MSLIIAGERSGVGKTTITLALLAALQRQQHSIQSFKVGPDYIDPMFHQYITGRACRNLDPVLTSPTYVQQCFQQHTQNVDYAIVEGVMGLFDGATGADDWGSTAHLARLLNLPVLLVLDCSRLSRSIAAIAHGYQTFDPRLQLAGLVLNRVGSDRHLDLLKTALEPLKLPILGILHRQDDITIPDRHLGLIPTAELPELNQVIDRLADLGARCFDWTTLLPLLRTEDWGLRTEGGQKAEGRGQKAEGRGQKAEGRGQKAEDRGQKVNHLANAENASIQTPNSKLCSPTPPLPHSLLPYSPTPQSSVLSPACGTLREQSSTLSPLKIAVAYDRAFSFYYADNLELLEQLGAELVFWSPLADVELPDVQGLYFGGGFPEVFAAQLSQNWVVRRAVRRAIEAGMPTYAECGGLMYLAEQLVDFQERTWEMVGVLPTQVRMEKRLTLGYRQATTLQDSPLLASDTVVWGHEFHRSALLSSAAAPLYNIRGYDSQSPSAQEGWQVHQVHASYVHLHWGGQPAIPARFLQSCLAFAQQSR